MPKLTGISKADRLKIGHILLANFIELHYSISELARFHKVQPRTALKLMCEAMADKDVRKSQSATQQTEQTKTE